ncbi:acetyl-CoA carboxylase biotin carboxyl carrier protein [Candidatus Margulisiibacteriota bacterium]
MVNWDLVKKLIEMVKSEEISGLAVEEEGVKYEVRRDQNGVKVVQPAQTSLSAEAPAAADQEEEGTVAIVSPMVGTFYRSPSPEAPAFVETGDSVESGKVVCIIEAMKLFNEIESEVKGRVVKVLVENGQPVEYNQKLMLIKKV